MQKINFQNLPNTTTPVNATNLNDLQTNVENAINLKADQSQFTITSGSGTVDSTYISNVENNHWEKYGKVVSYSFTMTTTENMSFDTIFISNLPRPVAYTRFTGVIANVNEPLRLGIDTSGTIQNAYTLHTPVNETIEGQITYITQD